MIFLHLTRPLRLGLKSLMLHKLRSGLTALGIIFGVCSVIAMLAIGEGASSEQQKMFRELGATNIIFRSAKPPSRESATQQRSFALQYGLTYGDLERIKEIPSITRVIAQREIPAEIRHLRRKVDARIVGTSPEYASFYEASVAVGRFLTARDERDVRTVCVLGSAVARKLFPLGGELGGTIRLRSDYYGIVGVLTTRGLRTVTGRGEKPEDFNYDIYIPLSTCTKRFGETLFKRSSGSFEAERVELHQITVQTGRTEDVLATADAVRFMLTQFHDDMDYKDIVPLKLLQQAEQTKRIFMLVLGSIAGISLLVGGIGIMNIMLATVTERTREIGIRRALGARQRDITIQFLIETVVLAGTGGILGLGLGIVIPFLVEKFTEMPTIVTPWSLALALGVSCLVGILFGLYPARRAALMDPIEALRHE